MQEKIRTLIMAVVFVVCLALIMIGQKNIGVPGLIMELAGLVGLLTLLFTTININSRFEKVKQAWKIWQKPVFRACFV
jgi:hypothetical protein